MQPIFSLAAMAAVAAMLTGCAETYGSEGPDRLSVSSGDGGYQSPGEERWRSRYDHTYSYGDDAYYQQCRDGPDPAGVIVGGLIGGLLGNAVTHGGARVPGTIAGVVAGGAVGAALTNKMDCEDRSYAYKSYYDGFNANRTGSDYEWRNERSGHSGRFRVENYYTDPDGFRCATYHQYVTIDGDVRDTRGHACRQPDGAWAVVD